MEREGPHSSEEGRSVLLSAIIREPSSWSRSVLLSVILREPSSWSRRGQTQRPQPDNMQRGRDLQTLSCKSRVSIKSFPPGFREHCGRGGRKRVRGKGEGGHQGSKALYVNKINTRVNSQRPGQHAEDLHRSTPDRILELREVETQSPYSN